MRAKWMLFLSLAALNACGDDGGAGPDGGGDDDDDGGAITCDDSACTPGVCGAIHADGCDAPIDCGACLYDGETIAAQGSAPSLALDGDRLVVAYLDGLDVRVAAETDGGWSDELVATGSEILPWVDLAIAPDGTRWISWSEAGAIVVQRAAPGGSWESFASPGLGYGHLAVTGDGLAYVFFSGPATGGSALQLARLDGTGEAWRAEPVAQMDAVALAVAVQGNRFHFAWRADDRSVWYGFPGEDANPIEEVDAEVSGIPVSASLALAIDTEGWPHVAYSVDDSLIGHAVKRESGWTRTASAGLWWGNDGDAALAIGADGVHLASFNAFSLQVADAAGPEWAEQTVSGRCSGESRVEALVDGAGTLQIVYGCDFGDGIYRLARTAERYPEGHAARCEAAAGALRDTACGCAGPQSDCCIDYSIDGSNSRSCSSSVGALGIAEALVCGDATAPASQLDGCEAAVSALTCHADGTDGVADLPDSCAPAWLL